MEVILKGNAAWQSIEYKKKKIAEMVKKIVFFIYVQSVNLYHTYFEL